MLILRFNFKEFNNIVVNSKKAKNRIITSKAQLNSLVMSMQQQLAVAKVTGVLQKSTEVMKVVNKLMNLPEISNTMRDMSMEMMKAGVIEEMMNDTLEAADEDELEEEAQEEVDKVLSELTDGLLGLAKPDHDLPVVQKQKAKAEDDAMEARLKALQSA
ncbi:Snf7-domain-containing protein [Globomyces pollinis-pini]|nr:Snf7-domain-containing protein [Globomyces pollinis-pini]